MFFCVFDTFRNVKYSISIYFHILLVKKHGTFKKRSAELASWYGSRNSNPFKLDP